MQDHDYSGAQAAARDMLDKLSPTLSVTQLMVLKMVSTGIAESSKMSAVIGLAMGLDNRQVLDATKAALAAYLAGLEAAPNLDEPERMTR